MDFLSQASFEELALGKATLPPDFLGHVPLARSLLRAAVALPPGSVIGVQGPWGRGKTDLLARVAAETVKPVGERPPGFSLPARWLNPWQYGSGDFILPLLPALERAAKERHAKDHPALERIRVLGIGLRWVLPKLVAPAVIITKAVLASQNIEMPGLAEMGINTSVQGALATNLGDQLASTVQEALKPKSPEVEKTGDAVADAGRQFRELVELALPGGERNEGERLLICIDDIDRCLPDHQVHILQGLRFLLAAQAPVTVVIAFDPALLGEALRTHYHAKSLDVDRYLDKMFDLRIDLLDPTEEGLRGIAQRAFARPIGANGTMGSVVERRLGFGSEPILNALVGLLRETNQANPRVLRRILDRLFILASATWDEPSRIDSKGVEPKALAGWLILADRWPALRACVRRTGIREGQGLKRLRELSSMNESPNRSEHELNLQVSASGLEGFGPSVIPDGYILTGALYRNQKPSWLYLESLDRLLSDHGL